ncbi:hypothetical protein [Paraburkholderia franconis]|uniref:hypothetical protein n=1 Tax=Paraburkholderia franconis TaxID=2654983 RepID=UPI00187B4557|nr:hypothetical protein [Paraburkholderia franconis]
MRHRAQINLGTLIAPGIRAGWMAWLTRPAEHVAPATSAMPVTSTVCRVRA